MAFLSNLLAVSEPKGMWISIVKAFDNAVGNYILAIILLTFIIRLIFSIFDIFNKYNQRRMGEIQKKMQPEEDRLKAKYSDQPQILQQKQNELRNRYYGKSQYAGCFVMLIGMVLNMVVLFGLWGGLNQMSAYKIYENYDNIKYTYVNCLNVVDEYYQNPDITEQEKVELFKNYEDMKFKIETKNGQKTVSLIQKTQENDKIILEIPYKNEKDFTTTKTVVEDEKEKEVTVVNENIIDIIKRYYNIENDENFEEVVLDPGDEQTQPLYLSTAISKAINNKIVEVYDKTQDKFLWIQNIWIADSPAAKSIVNFKTLKSQVGSKNFEADEEVVYNAFMPGLKAERNRTNGYYIIAVLCILATFLSSLTTKFYTMLRNRKEKKEVEEPKPKKKFNFAQFIIPVIFGLLALFYNAVFAIYMLAGQLISCILLMPQLAIVDAIFDRKNKKKKEETTVDYSRKF